VAHKPWRDKEAEALLIGQPATEDTFRRAAAKVLAGAKGQGTNNFKIELAKRAIVRALKQATEMDAAFDANAFQNSNP
jgi:xanthine dehydrogenase YagS FAD-binding subunit